MNDINEMLKKNNIELSKRLYNRTAKDYGSYRVECYLERRGKTEVPYFRVKFKNSGNYVEASLKNIIENKIVDIEAKKKATKKKVKTKKKQAKIEKKEAKKFIMNFNEAPILLSLDLSSYSSGWSVFKDGKLIDYGYIYQPKSEKWDVGRINYMKNEIQKIIEDYGINCVAMEDVILKNKYTLYVLSKLQGVIADLLYSQDIRFMLINPLEWKTDLNINRMTSSSFDSRIQSKEKTVKCINKDFKLDLEKEFSNSPKDLSEPCVYDVCDSIGLGSCALKRIKRSL